MFIVRGVQNVPSGSFRGVNRICDGGRVDPASTADSVAVRVVRMAVVMRQSHMKREEALDIPFGISFFYPSE